MEVRTQGSSSQRRSIEEQALRRELPVDLGSVVELSGLGDAELRQLTRRLARARTSCGCRVGEVGTLLALLSVAACWLLGLGDWLSSPRAVLVGVLLSVGQVIAGAVLGKLAGLGFAHLRYRSLVRGLVSRAPSRETHPGGKHELVGHAARSWVQPTDHERDEDD